MARFTSLLRRKMNTGGVVLLQMVMRFFLTRVFTRFETLGQVVLIKLRLRIRLIRGGVPGWRYFLLQLLLRGHLLLRGMRRRRKFMVLFRGRFIAVLRLFTLYLREILRWWTLLFRFSIIFGRRRFTIKFKKARRFTFVSPRFMVLGLVRRRLMRGGKKITVSGRLIVISLLI